MAKNDFKAFATDRNANVMSQEEWEALPALLSGFTAGKASSAQVNKVIRQASFIAAALAQFVSDKTQRDVLDNGDLPGFVELLGSGFAVEYLSRKNPFGDIKSDGTVQTALANLGLGEAAKRNVGTGANQIPDMSLFASSNTATAAAQKFPSGLILQCGQLNGAPNVSSTYGMRFPMTFSRVIAVVVTLNVTGAAGQPTVSATNVHNTGFDITVSPGSGYGSSADAYYIAMGY
ncbi:phage tail protein [Escherichia coli]|uniref:gp53-like domain-containing protein n=1 Tax=Enterobacteriaceae TaxID=543 RepID=UPI000F977501|nr:phage tail protein [Shigella flexneri]EFI6182394.1 phage tail protein [Escherichia coli]EFK3437890.1 phage tail protein [Escherichia coli]EFL0894283.1 phage tail protein [Escherichia coli]EHJ5037406.1 phage tail protein [Escherichia coli]EIN1120897.1 phage tail protein [Escherichia coli]